MAYNKEVLLDKVIQEYLKKQEPIGSETLKTSLQIKVSSATIRNYFKAFTHEGILAQPHASGGRIPTALAMKNYWRNKLDFKNLHFAIHSTDALKKACAQHKIFALIKRQVKQRFCKLINHENQYLILVFENAQVVIAYQPNFERFLLELIGLELSEIKNIAYQVMANELFDKINALQDKEFSYFGLEALDFLVANPSFHHLFFEALEAKALDKLNNGVYFEPLMPEGFMAVVQSITQEENEAKMLCIGSLMRDYESFYSQIVA